MVPVYLSCPCCDESDGPTKFSWWDTIGMARAIQRDMEEKHGIPRTIRGFFDVWKATRKMYKGMKEDVQ